MTVLELLWGWQIRLAVMGLGAALSLVGGLVAGHRAHLWLWVHAPRIGRRLPRDTGAIVGLLLSATLLAAAA